MVRFYQLKMCQIDKLIKQMQVNGVLLDANLLVLLIIGLVDPRRIATHKKLNSFYNEKSYKLLFYIINSCRKIYVSSHVLAETNGLMTKGLTGEVEVNAFLALKQVIELDSFHELHCPSNTIVTHEKFIKYGLTDIGLLKLLKNKVVLLSDDFAFSGYVEKIGLDSLNFQTLLYTIPEKEWM